VFASPHWLFRDTVDLSNYLVRCGEWDTKGVPEHMPHQDRRVIKVTVHPSYNPKRWHADNIALLHLEEEFELRPHLDTICLPRSRNSYSRLGCFASGWGKADFCKRNLSLT